MNGNFMEPMEIDIHTHSIASGHYTTDTVTDLARAASAKGLKILGVSEHGPAIPHSCQVNYFRNLAFAPSVRLGVRILYGAEVNILNQEGKLDLDDSIMQRLDYCIAGMHMPCIRPGTVKENTNAYIQAMKNPFVKVLAHPDDTKYPADYRQLVEAAMEYHVFLEINNSSLSPNGYRGAAKENDLRILELCREYHYPVLLSSDSHGKEHVGDFTYALALVKEADFPARLILNRSAENLIGLWNL